MENTYTNRLKGIGRGEPEGEYNFYIFFAVEFGWDIDTVNGLPLDYLEELQARVNAGNRARKK